jgi:hypothetical protein
MTLRFRRYAIYWTPPRESALDAFGRSWFGGETFGLPADLAARAIDAPAHYRFHATLKAPFRLAEGATELSLQAALDAFCGMRKTPRGGPLTLSRFQRYLGLVLSGKRSDIDWLAAQCVTHFDTFRAPTEEEDRERRQRSALTEIQRQHIEAFGYPFVLSEFRFHISLAGPLEQNELARVEEALAPQLAPFMAEPFEIADLTLLGEPADGSAFEPLSRHRFRR